MVYVKQLMEAVMYIEDQINQKIIIHDIAKAVGYSKFHFQRLFHQVTNRTVGQYITARKLTEAARVIRRKNYRIIDVSYMFGFESHETFTRAFKAWFGVLPNEWKGTSRIPLHLFVDVIKEDYLVHIQDRVVDAVERVTHSQKIVRGYRTRGDTVNDIYHSWGKLIDSCKNKHEARYGVIQYSDSDVLDLAYDYLAASESRNVVEGEGQQEFVLSEMSYLVFDHKGSVEQLPLTYRYIYGTWLVKNKYQLNGEFDFEYYGDQFIGECHRESITRIYIPIISG